MSCFLFILLAIAPLAKAERIALDQIKSAKTLPFDTRMLVAKVANFEISEAEAKTLASRPGSADAVIELTDLVQEFEHLAFVFWVLRMRSDLTDAQLGHIRERLEPLVGDMEGGRKAVYKQQGLWLLGNYPGDENERVLIKFLSERTHFRHSDFSDVAALSLGRIGTSKALDALQQYADRAKPPEGYESRGYDAAIKAQQQIRDRAEVHKQTALDNPAQPKLDDNDRGSPNSNNSEIDEVKLPGFPLAMWGIAILLIGGVLLFAIVIKRKS